ncbi:hypothetical protein M9458_042463, partial [Cirrhinus mrigala]
LCAQNNNFNSCTLQGSAVSADPSLINPALGLLEPPPPAASSKSRLSLERSFSAEEDQQKCVECALQPARVYTITRESGMLGTSRGSKENLELEVLKAAQEAPLHPPTHPLRPSTTTATMEVEVEAEAQVEVETQVEAEAQVDPETIITATTIMAATTITATPAELEAAEPVAEATITMGCTTTTFPSRCRARLRPGMRGLSRGSLTQPGLPGSGKQHPRGRQAAPATTRADVQCGPRDWAGA